MAKMKHTMLFEVLTGQPDNPTRRRVGGWTESWYANDLFKTAFEQLCSDRSLCLPGGAAIVGQRYQQVEPIGRSQLFSRRFPGIVRYATDSPQQTLLCRAFATGTNNSRQLMVRCLPDDLVQFGEYAPDGVWDQHLATYTSRLVSGQWSFRGRDLNAAIGNVLAITGTTDPATNGQFSLAAGITFAKGQFVNVRGVRLPSGELVSGKFKIIAATDSTHGQLGMWPYSGTAGGGTLTPIVYIYPVVGSVSVGRVVSRKVGRPFTSFRGRRTKTRNS